MSNEVNIVILKDTREGLIGTVINSDGDKITLKSPRIVTVQRVPGPPGQEERVGIQFVPYPFHLADYFLDNWDMNIDIEKNDIIAQYAEEKISKDVTKAYLESVTKLIIPGDAKVPNVVSLT